MTTAPTRSGHRIDLMMPDPAKILAADISEGLAKINRWSGATSHPLSVAQHSLLVAELMAREDGPMAALYGLLHDGHEYLMGDLTEPTRLALGRCLEPLFYSALNGLRTRLDIAIHVAFDIDYPRPRALEQLLWACHARVAVTEVRDLLAENLTPADFATGELANTEPLKSKIVPYVTWVKAESAFKDALNRYHAQAGIRRTRAFAEV